MADTVYNSSDGPVVIGVADPNGNMKKLVERWVELGGDNSDAWKIGQPSYLSARGMYRKIAGSIKFGESDEDRPLLKDWLEKEIYCRTSSLHIYPESVASNDNLEDAMYRIKTKMAEEKKKAAQFGEEVKARATEFLSGMKHIRHCIEVVGGSFFEKIRSLLGGLNCPRCGYGVRLEFLNGKLVLACADEDTAVGGCWSIDVV
jgi:hypothetical protein